MTIKERLLTQLLPLIIGPLLFLAGSKIMLFGFDEIQSLRQMERTPIVALNSLIPGPNNISGFVEAMPEKALVKSYHTNTPSVYYRYTHEIEKRDSDGNSYWDLVDTRIESINFLLKDHYRNIEINTLSNQRWIDWSVEQSYQTTTGDHRYTEYRIQPGARLFIAGFASPNVSDPSQLAISFPPSEKYTPIVSTYDKSYEQQRMGSAGIFYLWGGLALIAMSIYAFSVVLRVHKVWIYQTLLIGAVAMVLIHFSLLMMKTDLTHATERYKQQWAFTLTQLTVISQHDQNTAKRLLTENNGAFEDYHLNNELMEFKINLALSQFLLESQLNRMPEWILAPIWGFGIDQQTTVALNSHQQQQLTKRIQKLANSKLTSGWHIIFLFLSLGVMLIASYAGFRKIRLKRLIENIPTQQSLGLVPGMAEVKGIIKLSEQQAPLSSPMTHSRCCWYHYTVKEKRGSGKNASWVTITDDQQDIHFFCEDSEGRIKINPEGAEYITSHKKTQQKGSRLYTEHTLRLDDPLYAIGEAKPDNTQQDQLQISQAGADLPFILSNLPESKVMFRKAWVGLLFLNLAFTGVFSSGLLWFAQSGSFSPSDFLMAGLAGPIYMFLFTMMLHYNDIIFLRQRAERNWVNMGVAIRKRKNLIPSLETLVKEFMNHEQSIMTEVGNFRSTLAVVNENKESLEECIEATKNIKRSVNVAIENYPDLKSQTLVSQFMTEITRLDTELALLKNGYNDAVTLYNERLETFPDILFTWFFKFEKQALFS